MARHHGLSRPRTRRALAAVGDDRRPRTERPQGPRQAHGCRRQSSGAPSSRRRAGQGVGPQGIGLQGVLFVRPGQLRARALVPQDGDVGAAEVAVRAGHGTRRPSRHRDRPGPPRRRGPVGLQLLHELRGHDRRRHGRDPAQHHRRARAWPAPGEMNVASDYETILFEEKDGVAWVTLNRPDVHNAFNAKMQHELRDMWRGLRANDDIRCVVLTGAGEKSFCTGIDRTETMGGNRPDELELGSGSTPFMFDDPGENIGPKSNDMWKPVIAAVNGMACGGAFYMLGEVEFIIAAEHATFFDPHVTYGMTSAFEPIHMLQKMPFSEIMRLSLLGNHERMSAQRAFQIGLVSEVVPGAELHNA